MIAAVGPSAGGGGGRGDQARAAWYWGVVVRVKAADGLLAELAALGLGTGVSCQRPGTGHVTLRYAPVGDAGSRQRVVDRARPVAARTPPFSLGLGGFGEFRTPNRVVGWLGVAAGQAALAALRGSLTACDDDVLKHPFVPHLTLAYGDDPAAYGAVRNRIVRTSSRAELELVVDALWVAGFAAGTHPAADLTFAERLPLGRA